MTDEQIIKAADICRTGECSGCPYMETKRNWEAECKRLKDNADDICKKLDQAQKELDCKNRELTQAQKELDCKNRELTQLKDKLSDLRRDKDYLDGKTYAYEYAIKCFEKGS